MGGAVPPLPQYAFMAWCSGGAQGQLYLLPLRFCIPRWPCSFIADKNLFYHVDDNYSSSIFEPEIK
jgi:hypothetical protein